MKTLATIGLGILLTAGVAAAQSTSTDMRAQAIEAIKITDMSNRVLESGQRLRCNPLQHPAFREYCMLNLDAISEGKASIERACRRNAIHGVVAGDGRVLCP